MQIHQWQTRNTHLFIRELQSLFGSGQTGQLAVRGCQQRSGFDFNQHRLIIFLEVGKWRRLPPALSASPLSDATPQKQHGQIVPRTESVRVLWAPAQECQLSCKLQKLAIVVVAFPHKAGLCVQSFDFPRGKGPEGEQQTNRSRFPCQHSFFQRCHIWHFQGFFPFSHL